MLRKILFLLLFVSPTLLLAQSIEKGKKYYVFTESGTLNLRSTPEKGKVVQKLERGTQVIVTKTNNEDSNIPFGWVEVNVGKNKGFVSTQYLSTIQPSELEKAHLISSLKATDTAGIAHIQPISFQLGANWLGVSTGQIESNAFLKMAQTNKLNLSILDKSGKKLGNTTIFETGEFGCQNYKGGKIRSKLDPMNNYYFVISGFEPESITLSDKVNDKLQKAIREVALREFQKKNLPQEELKSLQEKNFLISANNNQFLISRIATKKGDFEHANLFLVYTLSGNQLSKQIFSNYDELSDDLAPYGGKLHLEGGFVKDGKLILIFYSNGFDGYLQEIYELNSKEMRQLAIGGGDAC
ncbi:MAG: SH3 domain-containing protein [Leptospiraceae bacterium]|nr:SH3 domain-containing protein [Leptospiraceae bacterium]